MREKPWVHRFASLLAEQPNRVFTREDLDRILSQHGTDLDAPRTLRVSRLIQVLAEKENLRAVRLERQGRTGDVETKTRYALGDVSSYAIAASLAKGAYLSHASAMFLHALTDQLPKTIYVNREQSPKPPSTAQLTQAAINRAFKRPPRTSTYVFTLGEARFVILSGKNTGRLEVAPVLTPTGELVDTTKLERTLIDIVVRPAYAGGVVEVLQAYCTAASRMSVNTLMATLKKLEYVYPYHQAIGFLLERAGLPERQLEKIRGMGTPWDFYLTHQIADPAYDSKWRIFYPQGL